MKLYDADGKIVGRIQGKIATKEVKSKHQLLYPPSWCMDVVSIRQCQLAGVEMVLIYNKETDVTYSISLDNFLKYGVVFNRGYNNQFRVDLDKWVVSNKGQLALFEEE